MAVYPNRTVFILEPILSARKPPVIPPANCLDVTDASNLDTEILGHAICRYHISGKG